MSLDADSLAEMARNRGLKLVRSRVRTPGKAGYGTFGLTDPSGAPVFGMEGETLTATADEVAAHLRGAEVSDWRASLNEVGVQPGKRREPPPPPAPKPEPKPKRKPKPAPPRAAPPSPKLREARPDDAEQLAGLFALLDYHTGPQAIRRNLAALAKAREPMLVIARDHELLGACAVHRTVVPHREQPVGRITILVVAEAERGKGLGRQMVEEGERRLAALGCGLVEVTSNDRLREAHAFYRHLGYERTSMRFAKALASG